MPKKYRRILNIKLLKYLSNYHIKRIDFIFSAEIGKNSLIYLWRIIGLLFK